MIQIENFLKWSDFPYFTLFLHSGWNVRIYLFGNRETFSSVSDLLFLLSFQQESLDEVQSWIVSLGLNFNRWKGWKPMKA